MSDCGAGGSYVQYRADCIIYGCKQVVVLLVKAQKSSSENFPSTQVKDIKIPNDIVSPRGGGAAKVVNVRELGCRTKVLIVSSTTSKSSTDLLAELSNCHTRHGYLRWSLLT